MHIETIEEQNISISTLKQQSISGNQKAQQLICDYIVNLLRTEINHQQVVNNNKIAYQLIKDLLISAEIKLVNKIYVEVVPQIIETYKNCINYKQCQNFINLWKYLYNGNHYKANYPNFKQKLPQLDSNQSVIFQIYKKQLKNHQHNLRMLNQSRIQFFEDFEDNSIFQQVSDSDQDKKQRELETLHNRLTQILKIKQQVLKKSIKNSQKNNYNKKISQFLSYRNIIRQFPNRQLQNSYLYAWNWCSEFQNKTINQNATIRRYNSTPKICVLPAPQQIPQQDIIIKNQQIFINQQYYQSTLQPNKMQKSQINIKTARNQSLKVENLQKQRSIKRKKIFDNKLKSSYSQISLTKKTNILIDKAQSNQNNNKQINNNHMSQNDLYASQLRIVKFPKKLSQLHQQQNIKGESSINELISKVQNYVLRPYQLNFTQTPNWNRFRRNCFQNNFTLYSSKDLLIYCQTQQVSSKNCIKLNINYKNISNYQMSLKILYKIHQCFTIQKNNQIKKKNILACSSHLSHIFTLNMQFFPLQPIVLNLQYNRISTEVTNQRIIIMPITIMNFIEHIVIQKQQFQSLYTKWYLSNQKCNNTIIRFTGTYILDQNVIDQVDIHDIFGTYAKLDSQLNNIQEFGSLCRYSPFKKIEFIIRISIKYKGIATIQIATAPIEQINSKQCKDFIQYFGNIMAMLIFKDNK